MAMRLNEKASRVLVIFKNKAETEFADAVVDYTTRTVRVTHPGRQIVVPFEAVNMIVLEEVSERE